MTKQLFHKSASAMLLAMALTGASCERNDLLKLFETGSGSSGSAGVALAAAQISSSSASSFGDAAADSSGNVYAAGYISGTGTASFGNSVTATGSITSNSAVLVKYDSSATAQWASTVSTGVTASSFSCAATDSSGNIYAAGYIQGAGTFTFGGTVSVTCLTSSACIVLVKYSSSGTVLWAKTPSTAPGPSYAYGVTVDSSDNVYLVGSVSGTSAFTFDSVNVNAAYAGENGVIIKFNSSGTAQWAKTASTAPSISGFLSVTADSSDNIYVAGTIAGTSAFTFDTGVTAAGAYSGTNALIVKYSASGTALLATSVTLSSMNSYFRGIAIDSSGNIYAAGYFSGSSTIAFSGSVSVIGASSNHNAVLVKYNSAGTALWAAATASGSYLSSFLSIAIDSYGYIYTSGSIYGNSEFSFGNGVTVTGSYSSGLNVLLMKYNSAGTALWARSVSSGSSSSAFSGVAVNSSQNIFAAGYAMGTSEFSFGNGITVTGSASGGNNAVLVKY